MSERKEWPTWVTQTLKYQALEFVLPMYGVLIWVIGGCWVLVLTGTVEVQWALLTSLVTSTIGGGMVTLIYLAFQSAPNRNQLYNAGKAEALTRSLGARHYLSWQWLFFGWLIILVSYIQPKRAVD